MPRCPGQDMRYWTPEDIFDVNCPYCDYSIEFWRDEPFRVCRSCQKEVRNPRIDLGCAKWCKFGDQCLGRSVKEQFAAAPVIEKLQAEIEPLMESDPKRYELIQEVTRIAGLLLTAEGGDPCRVRAGALLAGAVQEKDHSGEAARELLAATILEAEEMDEICRLVEEVLSDSEPSSIDVSVVRDALILADESRQNDEDLQMLSTAGAQMIFNLRRKKRGHA